MQIEFVGQSARDATNPTAATSRLINLFREPSLEGGYVLRGVLGSALLTDTGLAFGRALTAYNGNLVAVAGNSVVTCTTDGVFSIVGAVPAYDRASMAENNGKLCIAAGGGYFVYDGAALVDVTVPDIAAVGSVTQIGGYTVASEAGGRKIYWSSLVDPLTMPALNFIQVQITAAPIIRAFTVGETLLVFKSNGFEQYRVSGLAGASAFQRVAGVMVETGLLAHDLICAIPNGCAFVGSDGRAYLWMGGQLGPISTPPVESAIRYSHPTNVIFYTIRGHAFVCIRFEDGAAWCHDLATGEWHEREDGDGNWSVSQIAKLGADFYTLSNTGRFGRLSDVRADYGAPMVRRAVSKTLRGPVSVGKVEAYPRTGLDLQGGADTDAPADLVLRAARDGAIFGAPKPRSVGASGRYAQKLTWRALGQFRTSATIELSVSCPQDLPFLATIDLEASK